MTDDQWRRRREEEEDFGPPLFGDDPLPRTEPIDVVEVAADDFSAHAPVADIDDVSEGSLSFGNDTGPLPHWTEPPTGEIPRVLSSADSTDDLDVWSSFSGAGATASSPAWRDDRSSDLSGGLDDITGLSPVFEPEEPLFDDAEPTARDESAPVRREPGRITIGTDPTDGASSRPQGVNRRPRQGDPTGRGARPGARPAPSGARGTQKPKGGTGGRDMPTAIAVGLGIAVVFIAALKYKPWAVAVIVVLVLGLAAVEYFDRVREKGYMPAFVPGIMACVAAPAAVYHYGTGSLPLVLFLAFTACAITFVFSSGLESNPMPNMAITTLGITWIGVLGAFGAAIIALSNVPTVIAGGTISTHIGTDTLCLLAIGVVANDVGALFVGSAVGRTPLRAWISPNKSVEGFIGGTLATVGAMVLVGVTDRSSTWNSTGDLILLGLVVAIAAPIGDLTESMFKRNLDVKDFGSIVKGHGGILDRFDGFLFTLPAVYFLTIYLQPWLTK
ncbi:MAG: phosphatidate cytidylyltransferase [Actinobacteria bacterium]|nr:phosphatidate cytidylyltransferase [Actinomycetota bacterium]